jgi:hypothetical protein
MNHNSLKIISLVILSILITPIVITYSQASKTVDFLREQKENLVQNPHALLSASTITQYQGSMDAFVVKEPLIAESYNDALNSMDFEMYAITAFNQNHMIDKLAFYLKNVSVRDELAIIDNQGNLSIFIRITFNQAISNNDEFTYQIPFVSVYDVNHYLIVFEYDQWQNKLTSPLLIESISVEYEVQNALLLTTISITNDQLIDLQQNDYQPSLIYGDNYDHEPHIYYDHYLLIAFHQYWYYDLYFIGGEILILGGLFWVIFILPVKKKLKNSNLPQR